MSKNKKKITVEDFIGDKAKYDDHGQMIWGYKGNDIQKLLDISVRGWGAIQHLFKDQEEAAKFQDELGEWIADAINQKINKGK
jgi:hypothetical protein